MLKTNLIDELSDDSYQALWFTQTIDLLKGKSVSEEDIVRIIPDVIGEFIVREISLDQLLIFVSALEDSKANLTPDIKFIIQDLSALHQYKSDQQIIHNILIDALRKITQT